MTMRKVAVVGAGMTKFMRRAHETAQELSSLAVHECLGNAGLTLDDVDSVVITKDGDKKIVTVYMLKDEDDEEKKKIRSVVKKHVPDATKIKVVKAKKKKKKK